MTAAAKEVVKEYYRNYLEEARYEYGESAHFMTFEEYCDFFDIDDTTSDERVYEIFYE